MVAACLAIKAASRTGAISKVDWRRTRSVTAAAAASEIRASWFLQTSVSITPRLKKEPASTLGPV